MEGVAKNFSSTEKGVAKIKKFTITEEGAKQANLSYMFGGGYALQRVSAGDYVKLSVDGVLMMSDTPMERRTNREFIEKAKGNVMIAGLGIGLILENLKPKIKSGEVKSIVVYEKFQDVIDLVYPIYSDMPLEVRHEDILTYKPPKGEEYDTIYFDIWPDISTDNLPEMALLHQRWKNRKRKDGWMNSWMRDYLVRERKAEQRESRYLL